MRTRTRAIVSAAVVAILVGLAPADAAMAYGSPAEFRGRALSPTVYTRADGQSCTVSSAAAGFEYGKRGVTNIKIRFELRTPYDAAGNGWFRSTGYYRPQAWANDVMTHWYVLTLPRNVLNFTSDDRYALWVNIVGDRGWWRRDFTRHINLGEVACSTTADDNEMGKPVQEGGQIIEGGA
ncbi:MAG: hypothetical protein JWP66_1868 [Naasia sp.]|nr:hypothetical protein [Naasia sp.]